MIVEIVVVIVGVRVMLCSLCLLIRKWMVMFSVYVVMSVRRMYIGGLGDEVYVM